MPLTIPSDVSYGKVVAKFVKAISDSADGDRYPDGAPALGTVTFTPNVPYVKVAGGSPPSWVFIEPLDATINSDGVLVGPDAEPGIYLIATDDPDTDPVDFRYAVTFDLVDIDIPGFLIEVPSGGEVDLTLEIPV